MIDSSAFDQIGNPLLKLDRDIPGIYEFFWSHGMISDELGLTIMNQCDFEDYTFTDSHNISKSCEAAVSQAGTIITQYINYYDILLDICYPSLFEQELRLKKMVRKKKETSLPQDFNYLVAFKFTYFYIITILKTKPQIEVFWTKLFCNENGKAGILNG